jgi:Methylase involved in ubiquinone/menaquinone biosynthesis
MDKKFTEIFAKQPNEIITGDYFYSVPRFDGVAAHINDRWKSKTFQGEFDPYQDDSWLESIKGKNNELTDTLYKIALDDKPFMDIASSGSMGFAPYIFDLNPDKPCLVTDINAAEMKLLRSYINETEDLYDYKIDLASFDNCDMPIKDNSLDYITSILGISSSYNGENPDYFQFSVGREPAINEVYRVLKPGGLFITLEMNGECDYDLRKICYDSHDRGDFLGIYPYSEIQAVLELMIEHPWRDKFTAAGFEIEAEKKHYRKPTINSTMHFLHRFTKYNGIHLWEQLSWDEERRSGKLNWNVFDYDVNDCGFDLYSTNTLFILRKPL